MDFRLATIDDIETISDIFHQCWHVSYLKILPAEVRLRMDHGAAQSLWRPSLENPNSRETYIGMANNAQVSVFRLGENPEVSKEGHLFSLYVHPSFAGQGFGKSSLSFVIQRLSELGFREISLWVFKSNQLAQQMYLSHGFTFTEIERTDPRWEIPEVRMVRRES